MTLKKLPAAFYASPSNREPVIEWLKSLSDDDKQRVGQDIATAEYGWPVGMPVCRSLGKGLFEIRSNINSRRIVRVIFAVVDEPLWCSLTPLSKRPKKRPRLILS